MYILDVGSPERLPGARVLREAALLGLCLAPGQPRRRLPLRLPPATPRYSPNGLPFCPHSTAYCHLEAKHSVYALDRFEPAFVRSRCLLLHYFLSALASNARASRLGFLSFLAL